MPSFTKTGFIVHDVHQDYRRTKKRIVSKVGRLGPALRLLPPIVHHQVIMPRLPVRKLHMGEAQGIVSCESGNETSTVFWAVPYDTKQIKSLPPEVAVAKIVEAGRYCAQKGAYLIGLGAHTSIVGEKGGGQDVADQLNAEGVFVTSGDSLTAATGVEGGVNLLIRTGREPKEHTAAVIGAGGATGSVVAQLLGLQMKQVLVVGRGDKSLDELVHKIGPSKAQQTKMEDAIQRASLIITVTSATDVLDIDPYWFKTGAIVCDIARPRDVGLRVKEVRQNAVFVFDGSIIQIPGHCLQINWNFGFPPGTTYACMAETMVLGLRNYQGNYSLGKQLDLDKTIQIARWAKEDGFVLADYRSFDQPVSPADLDEFCHIFKCQNQRR